MASHEVKALSVLSRSSSNETGAEHIVQLLDHFEHVGPNGIHNCLVLELLGPNVPTVIEEQFSENRFPGEMAKRISKQAMLGLTYIRRHGFGHGGTLSPGSCEMLF
jgi:serine/threonine-protein kinase SRPK3